MSNDAPVLLIDIDGVLNPYAADLCPAGFVEHDLFPGEAPIRVCARHGQWLRELSAVYQLAWVSAWREHANRLLGPLLDLPPLDTVPLPVPPFAPSSKLAPVARYAGDRPLAWLDDEISNQTRAWRDARTAPTLLVDVDPRIGLTRAHVKVLLDWTAASADRARGNSRSS